MENMTLSSAKPMRDGLVTLAVPANGDATQLQKFINNVTQTCGARILKVVGSWGETFITLGLDRSIPTANILGELLKMPEVEAAKEKKLPKMQSMARREILVTLGTSSTAKDQGQNKPIPPDAEYFTKHDAAASELNE